MNYESTYWKDGEAYHRTAIGAKKRPQVFIPEIVYNLLAMAIEKYFMAFLEAHKTMPDNHTFTDLINAVNKIKPLSPELESSLKSLENVQDICPIFEGYQHHEPNEEQLGKMYEATDRVAEYCKSG